MKNVIYPLPPSHVNHHRVDKFSKKLVSVGSLHPEETLYEEVPIVHIIHYLLPRISENSSASCIVCPWMNYSINLYLQGARVRTRNFIQRLLVSILRTIYYPAEARTNPPEQRSIVHEIQKRTRNTLQHINIVSVRTPYNLLLCAKLELVQSGC